MAKSEYGKRAREILLEGCTDLYKAWYTRLRLEEELRRLRRYPAAFSIILIAPVPTGTTLSFHPGLLEELDRIRAKSLRDTDMLGVLGPTEVLASLPYTNSRGARFLMERLRARLGAFEVSLGAATCPQDGATSDHLIELARQRSVAIPGAWHYSAQVPLSTGRSAFQQEEMSLEGSRLMTSTT